MREALRPGPIEEALVTSGGRWTGVLVLPTVDSTNAEVARQGRQWYAVLSDHQEHGRGRLGRSWEDVPHSSLAVSALLPLPEGATGWMPLVTGVAVREAIARVSGVETVLKWPNDVLVPRDAYRKVCGILCELTGPGVVVGAGINVDQERTELPVESATSLRVAGAGEVSREALATAYLLALERVHGELTRGGHERERLQQSYRSACATIGAEVEVHLMSGSSRRARAVGVDADGRLVIDRGDRPGGRLDTVAAGDVTHVRFP